MDHVNYRDLFRAHGLFERYDYNRWYDVARRANWRNIHNLSDGEVRNIVLRFLNRWECRLPYDAGLERGIKAAM